jgi:hypothetical protein
LLDGIAAIGQERPFPVDEADRGGRAYGIAQGRVIILQGIAVLADSDLREIFSSKIVAVTGLEEREQAGFGVTLDSEFKVMFGWGLRGPGEGIVDIPQSLHFYETLI